MPSSPKCAVIVGAPRSGTNMLRDMIALTPGVCTWPCDEINYIWRHGNASHPDDELLPEHATPRVQAYIRRAFESLARRKAAPWVVEKTCANSLRVGFVDRILPDAKYVFLVRDGRDSVASAMLRWTAPMNWSYIARKARYVPFTDLPRYLSSYAANRIHRLRSAELRLASWGPRFRGMQDLSVSSSLAEMCAAQWERCVAKARKELADIESARVILVKYEQLVTQPLAELSRLQEFLGINTPAELRRSATRLVSTRNVGKWRSALDAQTLARIAPIMDSQLIQLGYQACSRAKLDRSAA
jgi:Sulfotransferase family